MRKLRNARKAASAVAALGIAAAAVALWRRFYGGTYLRFDTMFGKARVYEVADDDGEPVRLLEVGGIVQSGTYLDDRYTELVFEYLKRYDLMFEMGRPVRRVLVLGCGGYDYPEHLVANHPGVVVDAVEIDPAITAIAQRYFFLDRLVEEYETEKTGRLNLICDDALNYLIGCERRYDAIVNDAFDAGTPPEHLCTAEFLRAVREHLNPGGMYLVNIVAPLEGPESEFLHGQAALIGGVFENVRIVPCAAESVAVPATRDAQEGAGGLGEPDNVIVVASDAELRCC